MDMRKYENSWHYELIDKFTNTKPYYQHNFCQYTRAVIKGIFGVLFTIAMFSFFLTTFSLCMAVGITSIFQFGFVDGWLYLFNNEPGYLIGYNVYTMLALFISFVIFLEEVWNPKLKPKYKLAMGWLKDKLKREAVEKAEPIEKAPSFIWMWIKAKHDKVCFNLNWRD